MTLAGERHFVGAAAADLDHPVSPEAGHHLRTEHIITKICTSLEVTYLTLTTDHRPPLLLLDFHNRFEPADRTSHCGFEMHPLHMTSLLIFYHNAHTCDPGRSATSGG